MFEGGHKLDLRDSPPTGTSTTNSTDITTQTVTLSKTINTSLGGLIFLLTVGTYWFLTRYTTTLSNEIILPTKFIEDNIAAVLSVTWPKFYLDSLNEPITYFPLPWVLFSMKKSMAKELTGDSDDDGKKNFEALGSSEIQEQTVASQPKKSSMVTVKVFSPIMKNLVQIAIWNSLSFWLVLIMILNTLVYNGFLSNNLTNDSKIRLVLVGVYALTNLVHQYFTTTLLYRNFTLVLFQACWTILCRKFIFLNRQDYFSQLMDQDSSEIGDHSMVWRTFHFELFGTTECSDTYRALIEKSDKIGSKGADGLFQLWSDDDKRRKTCLKAQDKTESEFDKFVKPPREAEIKAYEKATESALEKALANIVILLGVCLATALAPWTSFQKINATAAQLGSYALLLSISTGLFALINSITQLTNSIESAKTLLLLQEKTIAASNNTDELKNLSWRLSYLEKPNFSFSKGIEGESRLTPFGLWRSTGLLNKLFYLLLGPALIFIPRFHRGHQNFKIGGQMLNFRVQDITFGCFDFANKWSDSLIRPVSYRPPSDEEQRQMQEKLQNERAKYHAIVEHQQEEPEINGNSDTSDASELL